MRKLATILGIVLVVSVLASPPVIGQTATEQFDACIEEAVDAAKGRAANDEGSVWSRFAAWIVDVGNCTAKWILPV